MKTDEQITDDIFLHLIENGMQEEISGEILDGYDRKIGSHAEDITIEIIAGNTDEVQIAEVNVNIYVPDEFIDGQYQKAKDRIDFLCHKAWGILKQGGNSRDYRFKCEAQRVLRHAAAENQNEHVIVNKIEYKHYNP